MILIGGALVVCAILLKQNNPETVMEAKGPVAVPILCYHHFDSDPEKWGEATMGPDLFKEHMLALKAEGYQSVSFSELIDYVNGRGDLPPKPIVITMDDGYMSNYTIAYPLFKELDMKAAIFPVGWSVGKNMYKDGSFPIIPHFDYGQAREMTESGIIELGSHSFDMHELGQWQSPRIGIGRLESEDDETYFKALYDDFDLGLSGIEDNTGQKSLAFAYPYGIYSEESERVLDELHIPVSLTTDWGINTIETGSSLRLLKRLSIGADTEPDGLIKLLNGEI